MDQRVEDALKAFGEMRAKVDSKLADIEKGAITEREVKGEIDRQFADLRKELDDIKRGSLPPVNPLTSLEEKMNQQRGHLFGGRMKLPYQRAMQLPSYHPALRGSDVEQLQSLQDLNDAVVLRYWHLRFKHRQHDVGHVLNLVVRSPEFRDYFLAMAQAGYAGGEDILKFAETALSDDPRMQSRANEIMHPGSGSVNFGNMLNFTLLSAQLFDKVRIELGVANEFQEIPLPRPQTDFPALLSDTMGILGGPSGAQIPARDYATGDEYKITMPKVEHLTYPTFGQIHFIAQHQLAFLLWNDDMFEDSVIPWLPLMRTMVSRAIARGIDNAILNGAKNGGANDIDITNAYDIRKSWDGLRKLADAQLVDNGGSFLTTGKLRDNRRNMGIWGRNPNEIVHYVHINGWYDLMKATEVLTVEKFGNDATVKTGVLAKLDGVDLKMSEFIRTDIGASGKREGSANTFTVSVCFNRTRFLIGTYGLPVIEETRIAPALSTLLQVDVRRDFKPIEQVTGDSNSEFAAGVTPVSVLRNITSA